MRVALIGRSLRDIESTRQCILNEGGQALALAADVTDPRAIEGAVAAVTEHFGPVRLLVNNAGTYGTPATPLLHYDSDDWWRVMEVNVRGPMLLIRAVLRGMIESQRGCIVNLGSYAATQSSPGSSAYSASKAALCRLTESLAGELTGTGVTVFTVSPGLVRTDMTAQLPAARTYAEELWDPPGAVAGLVIRLMRGDADRLSGCFLHVRDDLDELLANSEHIARDELFRLRLVKLHGAIAAPPGKLHRSGRETRSSQSK